MAYLTQKKFYILWIVCLGMLPLFAQTTVAIGSFENKTRQFFLDRWEEQIPELLSVELSRSKQLVVLERRNLTEVLKEQALSLTGLVDSVTAQEVGKMMGARYVINGTITENGNGVRITARIINVSTGKLIAEKAEAPDSDHLNKMIALLGNNLRHRLTGEPTYRKEINISGNPTRYMFIGTTTAVLATIWADQTFRNKREDYRDAQRLQDFDPLYDTARRWNNTRYILSGVAGTGILLTFYLWLKHLNPRKVYAATPPGILPNFDFTQHKGVRIGLRVALR